MKVLRSRLYEIELLQRQQSEIASDRRGQVGTGERSEKIRTYNFPQNRNHRPPHRLHDPTGCPRCWPANWGELVETVVTLLPVREAEVGRRGGAGVTGPRARATGPCPWSTGVSHARGLLGARGRCRGRSADRRRGPGPSRTGVGSRGLARATPRLRAPRASRRGTRRSSRAGGSGSRSRASPGAASSGDSPSRSAPRC